ncbi:hypothetical protein [Tunturiibacter gelidiferens]|uniref:hypothetical protein n=1 Tax=Tunturiibacter gelidiferens TaxID=3069689 RepID=UPI003D9B6805
MSERTPNPATQASGSPVSRSISSHIAQSTAAFLSPDPVAAGPQNRSQSDAPVVRPLLPERSILPEGEAILQPPMDNTPNDAPEDAPHRIPNLGHALLFLAIAGVFLFLTQLLLLGVTHAPAIGGKLSAASIPPSCS